MDSDEQSFDEMSAHLDRGWGLLAKGDLALAEVSGRRLLEIASDSADAYNLLGSIAAARGDFEEALDHYKQAISLDPDFVDPLLLSAELHLGSPDGEPDEALRLCEQALEIAEEEEEYLDALLLKAQVELQQGEHAAALATLAKLPPTELPEAQFHLRAGRMLLELGNLDEAEKHARAALAREPDSGDARHLLGLVFEERGDKKNMIEEYLKARTADLKEPSPPWAISTPRFEKLAEQALGELPPPMSKLIANIPVVTCDLPTVSMIDDGGDPRMMGLFAGTPLPEHADLGAVPRLECIYLFQRNIERFARTTRETEEEIRRTVLHETGRFFGLSDEDLAEMGLD